MDLLEPKRLPSGLKRFLLRHIPGFMAVKLDGQVCVATAFAQHGIGVVEPVTEAARLVQLSNPLRKNPCFRG